MQHLDVLNEFELMCSFLKAFKRPRNRFLTRLLCRPKVISRLPVKATAELRVWAAVVEASAIPMPIPHRPLLPSLYFTFRFGCCRCQIHYVTVKWRRILTEKLGDSVTAAVGSSPSGSI